MAGDAEPGIDFGTFILSLCTSAMMHLGLVPGDAGEVVTPNLPMAKQTIDCLAMLEEKTKGNLSGEEERLLAQLLYDLRLQYVAKSHQKG
jgi:hypothetical protein